MKTWIGIILALYVLAVAFASTDLNPLLLSATYRNMANAIPPQLHMLLIISIMPVATLARNFLRQGTSTEASV